MSKSILGQDVNVDNEAARVAKLADAPDLGLRNHRFQSVAFRFKTKRVYEGKTPVLAESRIAANEEQQCIHSSTGDAPDSLCFDASWVDR
jgi:hypothetical protein